MVEVSTTPMYLFENVVTHFEHYVFAQLPQINEASEGIQQKSRMMERFMKDLREIKKNGSRPEKEELFRYFIDLYLTGNYSSIISKKTLQDEAESHAPMANESTVQTTLFTSAIQTGQLKSESLSRNPHISAPNAHFTNEWVLNRVFMTMNFYSARIFPIFITKAQKLLQNSAADQTTLNQFTNETSPKILNTPEAVRIVKFIHKMGESFLEGLNGLSKEEMHPYFTAGNSKSGKNLGDLIEEFLISEQSAHIFPKWFQGLDADCKKHVIQNLLKK